MSSIQQESEDKGRRTIRTKKTELFFGWPHLLLLRLRAAERERTHLVDHADIKTLGSMCTCPPLPSGPSTPLGCSCVPSNSGWAASPSHVFEFVTPHPDGLRFRVPPPSNWSRHTHPPDDTAQHSSVRRRHTHSSAKRSKTAAYRVVQAFEVHELGPDISCGHAGQP